MKKLLAALTVVLAATAACGTQSGSGSAASDTDNDTPTSPLTTASSTPVETGNDTGSIDENAEDIDANAAASFSGAPYDEAFVITPAELAERDEIKLIVAGTVSGYADGPRLYAESADDPFAVPTIVMDVAVTDVRKGDAPANGHVYVQFQGMSDADAALADIPQRATVVFYLSKAPQADPTMTVNDADAGRPAGEPVWQAATRGFIVADGPDGGVVLPNIAQVRPNADIDNMVPAE